tara:strand:+ start:258 stop:1484 length:1227 start_codon:yes stop_codon:yes gene_type:complete
MALDARISMMGQAPNVGQAINIFENALMNSQTRDIRQQQSDQQALINPLQVQQAQQSVESNQQSINQNRQAQRLQGINITGQRVKPLIESGDIAGAQKFLLDNISAIQTRIEQGSGEDVTESMEALAKLQAGDAQGVLNDINTIQGIVSGGKGQKQFALQSNAPITNQSTGQVSTPVFDPATGETKLVPIEGAIKETSSQIASREQQQAQNAADLEVETTSRKETIKKTVARTSALKTEFSGRRRLAARSTRKIKEAQKLSAKATQGLGGAGLVQLARVFPGIDVKDEGALSGAFKSLALDELQKFKGPTTDFEFAVTEDIAGSLGSSASANNARLASLERANWFIDRESNQFNDHIKAGHDPDEFFFNFNELVTPKKGGKSYSLQSLQDTAVANHLSVDEVIKRLSK